MANLKKGIKKFNELLKANWYIRIAFLIVLILVVSVFRGVFGLIFAILTICMSLDFIEKMIDEIGELLRKL
jgi:hypothetical protein